MRAGLLAGKAGTGSCVAGFKHAVTDLCLAASTVQTFLTEGGRIVSIYSPACKDERNHCAARLHRRQDGDTGYSAALVQSSTCRNGACPFARSVSERNCSPRRLVDFQTFSFPLSQSSFAYRQVTSSQQRWTKVSNGGKLLVFCSFERTHRSISIPAGSVSPPGKVRLTG